MLSINNQLSTLASTYYISPSSTEGLSITTSVSTLETNLKVYFGTSVRKVTRFGSFTRNTILPRQVDQESDVDLMVIFNYDQPGDVYPQSLRERLYNFAKGQYPLSTFYRNRPVVVLELGHIQYDLVPAIVTYPGFSYSSTYIPKDNTNWQTTDPTGFNQILTDANVQYNSIVKPIVRLLKAWNAKAHFPIQPYLLEQEIAALNFTGDNVEKGFFWAISHLNSYNSDYSILTTQRINSLKDNAQRVQEALNADNSVSAQNWLKHILPV